jgi:hypothetical protein
VIDPFDPISKFWVHSNPARRTVDVYERRGRFHRAEGELVEIPDMCAEVKPTMRLMPEEAQALMDGLWDAGLRPVGGAGSAGQLDAVKYHLEDMRRLVFREGGGA